jgi:hypothetical protein
LSLDCLFNFRIERLLGDALCKCHWHKVVEADALSQAIDRQLFHGNLMLVHPHANVKGGNAVVMAVREMTMLEAREWRCVTLI